jgi:hypothetical protein
VNARNPAVADVTTDALEDFRGTRVIGKVTWKVERQMLISFFTFALVGSGPASTLQRN